MSLDIKLISTDFDGTLHADFESPPIPARLQRLLADLQSRGVKWVINTGRDLSSLMEGLGRAHLGIWPDYVVTVEREIHRREGAEYHAHEEWNGRCAMAQEQVFARLRQDLPVLREWVERRFEATIYEDSYSPFCLIAQNNWDADAIHDYLDAYCNGVPNLTVVRNDVYARFSHIAYNKGSALGEICRGLCLSPDQVIAAGDHLNDLPMLSNRYARWLLAPSNAIETVKEAVRRQNGYVSQEPHGHGVADGLRFIFEVCCVRSP